MKKFLATLLAALMFFQGVLPVCAEGESVEIESPSAILVEASTGTVIYEKAADEKRSPASVTKIMTALLIFEAIESGKIKLTDEAVTSAHAKSMGGSQVFLEEGEKQECRVTVPDSQLSLAIGNKGQNARLAARLTGWKIDIKPESGFYGEE